MKNALILVDIQNDFTPGGALPALEGDEVVPIANRLQRIFDLVVATQDWHPANHESFASNHANHEPGDTIDLNGIDQILWPDHCVQGSHGAAFHPDLETIRIDHIIHKGTDPEIDSYSTFFDNAHLRSTGLADFLLEEGVSDVYLAGLATDYCVKFSALDAVRLGFRTHVVIDGCRGVELSDGDVDRAIEEMRRAGVNLVTSAQLLGGGRSPAVLRDERLATGTADP